MRIVSITAGAGGMFCGSCLRDNAAAAALAALGHDALLVPTYTPITTDEQDVSGRRVFLGGVNVYLQNASWLFRHLPRFVTGLFDNNALLRWAGSFVGKTDYSKMGSLTTAMLEGTHGRAKREILKLVDWLAADVKPDVVLMTNALLSGCVPAIRDRLGVPVITTLQGDDVFLDALPDADRRRCIALIQENDRYTAGYMATSHDYAEFMSQYLGLDRNKIGVVYPGLTLRGHGEPTPRPSDRPPTLGYFARFAPEKGFHNAVDAFLRLKKRPGLNTARLVFGGWLGEKYQPYFREQVSKLTAAGLTSPTDFEHVAAPDLVSKVRFFQSIDVLNVPVAFREPKGLYVLEAWATGVPVVQPRSGTFPELVETTGGGLLYDPANPADLDDKLAELLLDLPRTVELGKKGHAGLHERFTARHMAVATVELLQKYTVPAIHPEPASV
ncbi:MAG: glycosyltransferase family 4 protein [Fimbriiglobus sp.]|nr:glycosyltransferase family 4 protein [Fimbriiglobus sp.]